MLCTEADSVLGTFRLSVTGSLRALRTKPRGLVHASMMSAQAYRGVLPFAWYRNVGDFGILAQQDDWIFLRGVLASMVAQRSHFPVE